MEMQRENAQVAELVDAHVSGACVERHAGSSPVLGTFKRGRGCVSSSEQSHPLSCIKIIDVKPKKVRIMKRITLCVFVTLCLWVCPLLYGQAIIKGISYDENKVPDFELPDPLVCSDGQKVTSVEMWETKRRPELLALFQSQVYGRTPSDRIAVSYTLLSENPQAMEGKATCKQVLFTFTDGKKSIDAILLLYLPNHVKGKVPVFVGYNFMGNGSTTLDPTVYPSPGLRFVHGKDSPVWTRGSQKHRWPYEKIIGRGYAVATMCYHDIYPDRADLRDYSVASLFPDYISGSKNHDEWEAIGVWAWGSSRIVDYLEQEEKRIDLEKIAIMGHSRQGKAALWTGAQDTRFKVVISNDSGCGGAALSKRVYGENIARITTVFPHWFCPAFAQYAGNEAALPFDQHELLALIAPRHLYVASAEGDWWADPKGEYLSAYYTKDVYALYGMQGLTSETMPPVHQPEMQDVGYHIREGKHDVTDYDWERFMDFCDLHFKQK